MLSARRLSLLSKECNQLLSVASVIGREFRLEILQKVAGLSDESSFGYPSGGEEGLP